MGTLPWVGLTLVEGGGVHFQDYSLLQWSPRAYNTPNPSAQAQALRRDEN